MTKAPRKSDVAQVPVLVFVDEDDLLMGIEVYPANVAHPNGEPALTKRQQWETRTTRATEKALGIKFPTGTVGARRFSTVMPEGFDQAAHMEAHAGKRWGAEDRLASSGKKRPTKKKAVASKKKVGPTQAEKNRADRELERVLGKDASGASSSTVSAADIARAANVDPRALRVQLRAQDAVEQVGGKWAWPSNDPAVKKVQAMAKAIADSGPEQ